MIQRDAGLLCLTPEPRIAQRGRHNEVHATAKKVTEGFFELAEPGQPRTEIVFEWKLNDEIKIAAAWVEITCRGRAEKLELSHAEASAKLTQSWSLLLDR